MKKILFCTLLILGIMMDSYGQTVTFKFSGGLSNGWLKTTMEQRISALLSEINKAGKANRDLSLASLNLTDRSMRSLAGQWKNIHFVCEDNYNVANCLEDINGYEVRGIPVTIKPMDNAYQGGLYKELVIRFEKGGNITSVHMALENNTIMTPGSGSEVTDTKRRREILNFVEEFRSYYDEKDTAALRDVFSNDALIITGTVVQRKTMGNDQAKLKSEVRYRKYNKEQYLNNLKRVFANNRHIKVRFDSIKVERHNAKEGFYGVTLFQEWKTDRYSDEGYVFLLWEFPKEGDERARIHVRTWQPEWGPYGSDGKNRRIKQDEIMNHNDFFIP